MKTDKRGCSTCPKETEHYEFFNYRGKKYVQYDYRDSTGKLFSCVAPNLKTAREKMQKAIKEA